ncbi:6629_t:CDS:2, partial [Racocetra fulgida]
FEHVLKNKLIIDYLADDSVKSLRERHFGATFNTLKLIARKEGLIGLYRGVSPNLAGSAASAITVFMTNPFWVVKTRMCVTSRKDPDAYKGLIDGLYQIAKYEGIRGLYKGLVPGLLGVSNGAVHFMFYEEMKKWRLKIAPGKDRERLDNVEYILVAGSSKTIAIVATYPYQLIRTRLNNQKFVIKYN